MKYLTYLIYTAGWQGFVWWAFWTLCVVGSHSFWWVLLAMFFSGTQFKPSTWVQLGE